MPENIFREFIMQGLAVSSFRIFPRGNNQEKKMGNEIFKSLENVLKVPAIPRIICSGRFSGDHLELRSVQLIE